ncbi:hypothetical protein POM88_007279 [Heracleum sosnowskyi]|uniref:Uncharacterized protein n=1 Tax=Heracleum sosnowskyi TaxID=360622 RepID=A0AAD8J556_9APIA|nr:hypothetical protein POM88_007279 [Heracleum sosnowskyi]
MNDLRSQLKELIPEQQERIKKLKAEHGKVQLGNIPVDMVLGGMRGMTGLLWETSLLDAKEGVTPDIATSDVHATSGVYGCSFNNMYKINEGFVQREEIPEFC